MKNVYGSVLKPGVFTGKHMIVTGGGSGIGRCCAHEMASLGAKVYVIGRNSEKLEKTCEEIAEDGGEATGFSCDIRDEELVHKTVKSILDIAPRIDGLLNNAGGQYPAPIETINQKGFETVVRTNLVGGFLMAKEVFNLSMKKSGGSIVNITADYWGGMPSMGHSGAARAGMENFTKTAAVEWGWRGVRVNAVAPGWIASSGMDTYKGKTRSLLPKLKEGVPLKRLGTEAEVSSLVCFLMTEGALYINGASIRVDGGSSLGNRVWPLPDAQMNPQYNGFHRYQPPEVLDER